MFVAACSSDASFESFASAGGFAVDGGVGSGLKPGGPGMASDSPCPGFDPPPWARPVPRAHWPPRMGSPCAVWPRSRSRTAHVRLHHRDLDARAAVDLLPDVARLRSTRSFPAIRARTARSVCSSSEARCASFPEAAVPGSPDAGIARWRCAPPPGKGCPAQRPSVGSDCVIPMDCDYGSCALGRAVVYSCLSTGLWVQADFPESCP